MRNLSLRVQDFDMKILVFTEGTLIMHSSAKGHKREKIVEQVKRKDQSIRDYQSYIPIGGCVNKLKRWNQQGAKILYLTSRRDPNEIEMIRNVLKKYKFPKGELLFRKDNEEYRDIAERVIPDVLIEDDCESIGGEKEMTITYVKPEIRTEIESIVVKEFGGIDKLLDDMSKQYNKYEIRCPECKKIFHKRGREIKKMYRKKRHWDLGCGHEIDLEPYAMLRELCS